MRNTTLGLLAAVLLSSPLLAGAQTETLTYSGDELSGTLLITMYSGPQGDTVMGGTVAFDGTVTGSVVLSNPLPLNGTTMVDPTSANFLLPGPIGSIFWNGSNGTFQFTTSNGAVTGWDVGLGECPCYGTETLSLVNGGDSYSLNIGFTPDAGPDQTLYSGSTSGTSGTWVAEGAAEAPEIDPSSAIGGLTLLLGGLAVVRGRSSTRA